MESNRFKYIYSILLLLITVFWAGFSVWITYKAASDKLTLDILASAGANILLGNLITMCVDVKQYWFRKALPKQEAGNGN